MMYVFFGALAIFAFACWYEHRWAEKETAKEQRKARFREIVKSWDAA